MRLFGDERNNVTTNEDESSDYGKSYGTDTQSREELLLENDGIDGRERERVRSKALETRRLPRTVGLTSRRLHRRAVVFHHLEQRRIGSHLWQLLLAIIF